MSPRSTCIAVFTDGHSIFQISTNGVYIDVINSSIKNHDNVCRNNTIPQQDKILTNCRCDSLRIRSANVQVRVYGANVTRASYWSYWHFYVHKIITLGNLGLLMERGKKTQDETSDIVGTTIDLPPTTAKDTQREEAVTYCSSKLCRSAYIRISAPDKWSCPFYS